MSQPRRKVRDWKPFVATNESMTLELKRFDQAQKLITDGRVDEARKIWWWPKSEDPPKQHWSRKGVHICTCGRNSPDGVYGLCAYCQGTTPQTPSLVVRHAGE